MSPTQQIAQLQRRVIELETALRSIADYRPEYRETLPENEGCKDCEEAVRREWPPSRLCDTHYSVASRKHDENRRRRNTQDVPMRDIARDALSAGGTP